MTRRENGLARWLVIVTAAVLGGVGGVFMRHALDTPTPVAELSPAATEFAQSREGVRPEKPQRRPDFVLRDMQAKPRDLSEWDGKVLVVNFWATWCPPCREEIPDFVDLQQTYGADGLQFLGIALDIFDSVKPYAEEVGINYPILFGESQGFALMADYGNRIGALPYSVVVDRKGNIVFAKAGLFERALAEKVIREHL